ncbi:hypothetical protein M970_082030 [Encephalitozoon cuniculi EcunIII-L]|uniref:Uncharacterized protein n=1 Tax=Encephalitozoon cuniculi TaxID=6035 RepID=M1JM39_ENCCN|nr:hypothetical protein ECU08_2030 [Encephalitozoon cuniculi]KMV65726.1 hypothetical protein M970_082030 [Encephalitozoon cuniculi EcunIII-L]UYI27133.1 hypothetical protein J0A71_04g09850 [Encephalitozoon cuniculi]
METSNANRMNLMTMLVISCVLCQSDPIKVRIVSKVDAQKYLSLFDEEVRLTTKEKIKDNGGCSKFIVDEVRTEILQNNKRICKRHSFSKAMVCTRESKNSTWEVVLDKKSKFVSFKLNGEDGGCLSSNGSESTDALGSVLSIRECDENSDAQKFWIKLVVKRRV